MMISKRQFVWFAALASGMLVAYGCDWVEQSRRDPPSKWEANFIYQVDREALGDEPVDWPHLIRAMENRIAASGTEKFKVRRHGEWEIEVVVPRATDAEIERIKRLMSTPGVLELRLVANPVDHAHIIALAKAQSEDPSTRGLRVVRDGERRVGHWADVDRVERAHPGMRPLRLDVYGDVIRNAATGELLDVPQGDRVRPMLERWLDEQDIPEVQVLLATDDGFDITAAHVAEATPVRDEQDRPSLTVRMRADGANRLAGLTGTNLPDRPRNHYRRLGIVLDGRLLSAPRIMSTVGDRWRLTGDFTEDETVLLAAVLKAGPLPVPLQMRSIRERLAP
jgi:SecD/SecF fusion protein